MGFTGFRIFFFLLFLTISAMYLSMWRGGGESGRNVFLLYKLGKINIPNEFLQNRLGKKLLVVGGGGFNLIGKCTI